MSADDGEVPPLNPLKVAVFTLALGLIGFAAWIAWRSRSAAVAAPVSGIALLKPDETVSAPPKPVPAAEPSPKSAPVVEVKAEASVPAKPVKKAFNQPRLNSGAFSGLNGGTGIGYSGRTLSGGSAAPAISAPEPAGAK